MDWAHDKWYVRYLTGLSSNSVLLSMVDKPRRRAENDYRKAQKAEDEKCEALSKLGIKNFTKIGGSLSDSNQAGKETL